MTLSQSQLRLISSLGIGILVGTSLIVIIPEGIEAVATTGVASHSHGARHARSILGLEPSGVLHTVPEVSTRHMAADDGVLASVAAGEIIPDTLLTERPVRRDDEPDKANPETPHDDTEPEHAEPGLPTFFIGFALITGFVLMFLVDRLPRHASENFQSAPATRHISLDNLETASVAGGEESESFLGSLAPTPKQSRSLATTTGLVIHAAAEIGRAHV